MYGEAGHAVRLLGSLCQLRPYWVPGFGSGSEVPGSTDRPEVLCWSRDLHKGYRRKK